MTGRIVILNGAPRAGKSSIASAMQAKLPGGWINWGVDRFNETLPPHLLPGIGLRPGGERPELEQQVQRLYQTYFAIVRRYAEDGFDVVADLGLHADYAEPFDAFATMTDALAGLPVFVVGVSCRIETIMARRRVSPRGELDRDSIEPPAPVRRWQEAVHRGHCYHLNIDTDDVNPEQAARKIATMLTA
jgi:chloramphenicol 3-O phosphotransferase